MQTSANKTTTQKPKGPTRLGDVIRAARKMQRPVMTQAALAEQLKVSRQAVNLWEQNTTKPDGDRMVELQRVLGVDLDKYSDGEMLRSLDSPYIPLGDPRILRHDETRQVPVLRTTPVPRGGSKNADFLLGQEIVDRVSLPPRLAARSDVRAIRVQGDRMAPRYLPNEMVFIGHTKQPTPGDFVLVVRTTGDDNPEAPRPAMVRRLVSHAGGKFKLEQYNPAKVETVDDADVYSVERIVPLEELV